MRLRDSHFGQEAEAAEIHTDDRNVFRCDQAGDAEQRAVATEDDDEVGAIGEVMPLDGVGADLFRRLRLGDRNLVPGAEKAREGARDFNRLGPVALDDQADRFNGALRLRHQTLIMR